MRLAKRRARAVIIALVGTFAAPTAFAESWPQRTVRVIVPNPPGVGLDITARLFAERLSLRWGKAVIVEKLNGETCTVPAWP